MQGLVAALEHTGVEIRNGSPVVDVITFRDRVVAVHTPSERIEADHVVIAAGALSGEVGKLAGARLPIEGGKGYALDFADAPSKPQRSISLRDAKIAVSPFDGGLRLSGTMELSGLSDRLTMATATAASLAELITTDTVPDVLKPSSASRFKGLL